MKEHEWEVPEVLDDISLVNIDGASYFVDKEEGCIAHAILCVLDELKNIRTELGRITEEIRFIK